LHPDTAKENRPNFNEAARPEAGRAASAQTSVLRDVQHDRHGPGVDAFLVFMVGLIIGALWVVVSLGDAIADGADASGTSPSE